jgi:hypothetical protein
MQSEKIWYPISLAGKAGDFGNAGQQWMSLDLGTFLQAFPEDHRSDHQDQGQHQFTAVKGPLGRVDREGSYTDENGDE